MKAVLVMENPECCGNCPLMDDDCAGGYCNAHDDDYIDIPDTMGGKPDWCPLQELPKRKAVIGIDGATGIKEGELHGQQKGWNACIDKILDN